MNLRPYSVLMIGPWILLSLAGCASTPQDSVEWGRRLAEANCARCHAVGPQGRSPNAFAPEFRNLRQTHSQESIEATFAKEGVLEHPPMPHFAHSPGDGRDILNYIETIQTPAASPEGQAVERGQGGTFNGAPLAF